MSFFKVRFNLGEISKEIYTRYGKKGFFVIINDAPPIFATADNVSPHRYREISKMIAGIDYHTECMIMTGFEYGIYEFNCYSIDSNPHYLVIEGEKDPLLPMPNLVDEAKKIYENSQEFFSKM